MTAEAVGANRLDIGRVVGETLAVTQRNLGVFGLAALLLGVLPSVLVGLLSVGAGETAGYGSAENIVISLSGIILQGAIIHGVATDQSGRRATLGECLSHGGQLFVPLFGIGLLAGLGILLGLLLLIVPGLMLATMWAVSYPARVVEGAGVTRALQRSQVLTEGNRLRVFGLFLLVWGGVLLVALLLGLAFALFGMFGDVRTPADVVAEALITGLATTLPSVCTAVVYLELRRIKEGSVSLGEIFA